MSESEEKGLGRGGRGEEEEMRRKRGRVESVEKVGVKMGEGCLQRGGR